MGFAPAVSTYSHSALPVTGYTAHSVASVPAVTNVAPITTYTAPVVSHKVARQLNLYNSHVPVSYAGVYNAAHAVAATPLGLTHPSNVGLCFNNEGVQVSC